MSWGKRSSQLPLGGPPPLPSRRTHNYSSGASDREYEPEDTHRRIPPIHTDKSPGRLDKTKTGRRDLLVVDNAQRSRNHLVLELSVRGDSDALPLVGDNQDSSRECDLLPDVDI
jgi:hypothetical protein